MIIYNETKAWKELFTEIEMILEANKSIDHPLQPIVVKLVWRHEEI